MNILYWLKLGMAIYLTFSDPVIIIYDNSIVIDNIYLSNLTTAEMDELIKNGVRIGFAFSCSLIINENNGQRRILRFNEIRSIYYNHLSGLYCLEINGANVFYSSTLREVINKAKIFEDINFDVEEYDPANCILNFELKLVRDSVFERSTGMVTGQLWDNYIPRKSVTLSIN